MNWTNRIEKGFRYLLPTPFTIAIVLTLLSFLLGLFFGDHQGENAFWNTIGSWEKGLWNSSLMVFAMQMMLMLVLGHVLALTPAVDRLIQFALRSCNTTAQSAYMVTLLSVAVGLFNWGLGLIFGAIFARKVAERAVRKGIQINYPLIGAAGYTGIAVWHGGISGSSLIKVAENGHLAELMSQSSNATLLASLPARIGFEDTVLSSMNISVSVALLLLLPIAMYLLGKRVVANPIALPLRMEEESNIKPIGAEKLDHSKIFSRIIGGAMMVFVLYKLLIGNGGNWLNFFNPNNINLSLFSLALLLHSNFNEFLKAIEEAIPGVGGILIQFPLYFGIMGIMQGTGLVDWLSAFFVQISNGTTYPIYTFVSAGLVNIFVPSGGGQWAVQGPIIIQAAHEMNIPLSKCILAMAYGDELTNMLQPFWALPLLGITGLKAREILPYTVFVFLICALIFLSALVLF